MLVRRTLEAMTHMPRDSLWFVLSLIWLVVLLVAIPVCARHVVRPLDHWGLFFAVSQARFAEI